MDEDGLIALQFNEAAIRILRDSVTVALRYWPGGDPDEQEGMKYLESLLNGILLEYMFENS